MRIKITTKQVQFEFESTDLLSYSSFDKNNQELIDKVTEQSKRS